METLINYFDCLHFTECDLEGWSLQKTITFKQGEGFRFDQWQLLIETRNIGILPAHPLNPKDELIFWQKCLCIFTGVKKSVLQSAEYVEDPPGSKNYVPPKNQPPNVIEDSFPVNEPVTLFELEGIYKNPLAWVDWEIESVSFALQVDTEDERSFIPASKYCEPAPTMSQIS